MVPVAVVPPLDGPAEGARGVADVLDHHAELLVSLRPFRRDVQLDEFELGQIGLAAEIEADLRVGLVVGEADVESEFREVLDVCYKLWEESWDDDAVEVDRESGRYTDPDKVSAIGHEGEHFSVPGPHGCEPSPQRTPVIYQAGSSDRGREFAAANAEGVFASQPTEEGVREYMTDVKSRAADHGRDPESLRFFIGVVPIVGETEAAAEAKHEAYKSHVDVEATLALLSGFLDMDLSELDPDQKVEHIETDAIQGTMNAFTKAQPDREWTVREVAEFCGLGTTSPKIVGTPEQIVDELAYWHEEVGVDGFNVKEVVRPDSLTDFVDLVVPELRERGLVPDPDDAGDAPRGDGTLRERLLGRGQSRLRDDHPAKQ